MLGRLRAMVFFMGVYLSDGAAADVSHRKGFHHSDAGEATANAWSDQARQSLGESGVVCKVRKRTMEPKLWTPLWLRQGLDYKL